MQNNLSIYKCWWKYLKDGLQAAKEHFFLLRFLFPHAVLSMKIPPPHRAALKRHIPWWFLAWADIACVSFKAFVVVFPFCRKMQSVMECIVRRLTEIDVI